MPTWVIIIYSKANLYFYWNINLNQDQLLIIESPLILVPDPKFSASISNVTVPVGREAVLTCLVSDLGTYKVAWLRVDTQTILTIQNHVITKNHRIGITYTEKRIWQLRIKDVKETDRGWYMCQINADPMKSQVGFLEVVGKEIPRNFLFANRHWVYEYNRSSSCWMTQWIIFCCSSARHFGRIHQPGHDCARGEQRNAEMCGRWPARTVNYMATRTRKTFIVRRQSRK